MADGFSGDLNQLKKLEEQLLAINPNRVAARVAPMIAALIAKQFVEGKNPYGTPWKPLAPSTLRSGRTPPPLTDGGSMKGSVEVVANGQLIRVSVGTDYAIYHQSEAPRKMRKGSVKTIKSGKNKGKTTKGTPILPRRPMLPWGTVLPKTWEKAIAVAWADEIDATIGSIGK